MVFSWLSRLFAVPLPRLNEKECLVTSFKTKQEYDTKQICEYRLHAYGHTLLHLSYRK